ncbi:MAG: hypothetical protein WEE50_01535, partial [Chloroflexota bacterium]
LLIVGAIPLALRAGYLTDDQIRNVGSLWPLILIGIGVGILLARTRYAFLGGILVAATFGVIVGGVLSGGVEGIGAGACGPGGGNLAAFPSRDGSMTEASGSVDLELNCGDVTLAVAPGSTWSVEGEARDGRGPNINADNDSLRISSHDGSRGWFDGLNDREIWRVTLPESVRLDFSMDLNAGSSTLDLGGASIDAFDLTLNAGSVTLDMGSVSAIGGFEIDLNAGALELTVPNVSFDGSIGVNAGSVSLCTPPGAALRLTTAESIVASYDYADHGLVKDGSTWETPGFDTAAVRIELDTRANAGSFSLNPEDGCGG